MAFREPERTPSARLLAELRQRRASFFEYSLELARDHHEYFLAMRQDGDEERRLEQAAAESLAEAEALERRPAEPFADYLRRYFASV